MRGALRQIVEAKTLFGVCEAGDGLSAIQTAKESCCDVALLDVGMPQTNGVQTAYELRQALPDLRLVAFSALAEELGEELVARKTFDAVLSKFDGLAKPLETLRAISREPF